MNTRTTPPLVFNGRLLFAMTAMVLRLGSMGQCSIGSFGVQASCASQTPQADLVLSGGQPPYQLVFSASNGSVMSAEVAQAGAIGLSLDGSLAWPSPVTVTLTDALGCTARDSITLTGAARPVPAFSAASSVPLFQPIQFSDQSGGSITSWQWDFGDGQTSVAQNPSYSYVAMGTFTVCLTVTNATCDSTTCMQVTVGPPVEVTDAYLSQYVQVYPNPSDGDFAVAFDLPQGLDIELEIIDLAGQRVLARSLRGVRTQAEALDIRDRAAGVYFLRIRSSKGHQMIAKLVKQ